MSEQIYKILLRKHEYDVHVKDSAGNNTLMWFKYCNTKLTDDVYIPENLSYQELDQLLTNKVRENIRKYNNKWYLKKCKRLRELKQ